VLPAERRTREDPAVGTKLYFPFNGRTPEEGGSTFSLHDRQLERALNERCGVNRQGDAEAFEQDLRLLRVLARLPTLDPFLLRDVLENEGSPSTSAISISATINGRRSRASSSRNSCQS